MWKYFKYFHCVRECARIALTIHVVFLENCSIKLSFFRVHILKKISIIYAYFTKTKTYERCKLLANETNFYVFDNSF